MVILATAGQRHEALMLPELLEAGAVKRTGRAGRGSGRPRWLVTRATPVSAANYLAMVTIAAIVLLWLE